MTTTPPLTKSASNNHLDHLLTEGELTLSFSERLEQELKIEVEQ
jgi:hypothetical protein